MAKNKTDFLMETAKDNKSIQMDELVSKSKRISIFKCFISFYKLYIYNCIL
jgi:hypothetical protein